MVRSENTQVRDPHAFVLFQHDTALDGLSFELLDKVDRTTFARIRNRVLTLLLRDVGTFPDGHPLTSIVVMTTSCPSALAVALTLGLRVVDLDARDLWEVA